MHLIVRPNLNGCQSLAADILLANHTMNLLRRPISAVVERNAKGSLEQGWHTPSLLASFAEMFVQDVAFGRATCSASAVSSRLFQAPIKPDTVRPPAGNGSKNAMCASTPNGRRVFVGKARPFGRLLLHWTRIPESSKPGSPRSPTVDCATGRSGINAARRGF
ncbi:MAG: hypothetical protein ACR2IV_05470 [Bryobacteraceae bacterium]